MKYAVVTTERAAREIENAAAWWASERSIDQANRWYQAIRQAIAGLSVSPRRCPSVEERGLPYEVRELHFGLGPNPTHRVLFTILQQTVVVLTVLHDAREPLNAADLP